MDPKNLKLVAVARAIPPRPCPLCRGELGDRGPQDGREFTIWAGYASSSIVEVACLHCRLRVTEDFSRNFESLTLPKGISFEKRCRWVLRYSLNEATRRWNALPRRHDDEAG